MILIEDKRSAKNNILQITENDLFPKKFIAMAEPGNKFFRVVIPEPLTR